MTREKDGPTIFGVEETIYDPAVCEAAETMPDKTVLDDTVPNDTLDRAQMPAAPAVIEKGMALLDTYRIESNAIEGGMGKVWRVHHTGWNTDLAMKQPKENLFQTEKQKENFTRECEAWINLGLHPHIVSCYYVREIGSIPTIFSEWMDGGSLKDVIENSSLYAGSTAEQSGRMLDIAIQFVRGLNYAHEQGLIHQDVKPDNLLLSRNGEAKVADFGIARARAELTVLDAAMPEDSTMFSAGGGYTPAYCSMEQMNGLKLTRRTDIYSWAVSVMEMFLGDRPWQNGVIAGAACEEYFPDAKLPIPQKMQELLRECLNAKEGERPRDFAAVENRLLEIYREEVGGEYPRPVSKAAADTADSLNNRALSFLDLGKPEEAERCWERALKLTPGHLQSIYNQSLHLWRNGSIDDREAAARIAVVDKQAATRIDSEDIVLTQIGDFSDGYTRFYNAVQIAELDNRFYFLVGHQSGAILCKDVMSKKTLWDVTCHKNRGYLNYSGKGGITGLEVSPDKLHLYSYGPEGMINKIELKTGAVKASLNISAIYNPTIYSSYGVSALAISFDGEWIACISDLDMDDSPLFILNANTLQPFKIYKNRNGKLHAVAFLPDGHLITGAKNGGMSIWDRELGLVKTVLPETDIKGLSGCADGNVLVCDGLDHMFLIDASGSIKRRFTKAYGEYCGMKASKTGIAVASFDRIMIYDTHSGGCAKTIPGSKPAITMEGRYLATGEGMVYALTQGKKADYMLCAIKNFDETAELDKRFLAAVKAGYDALERLDLSKAQAQLAIARALKGENLEWIRLNDAIGAHGKRTGIRAVNHINRKLEHPFAITDVGINNAKDTVLCLSGKNQLYLYTKEGELKKCFRDIETELLAAYFSINDKTLVCLGPQSALLIDLATNEMKRLKENYIYITTDLRYGIVNGEDAGAFILYDLEKSAAVRTLSDCGRHVLKIAEQNDKLYLFFTDRIGSADTFISNIDVISLKTLQPEGKYCFSQNADYRTNTAFSVHNLYCIDRQGQFFGGKIYKNQPAVLSGDQFLNCDGKLYPIDNSLVAKFDKSSAAITAAAFSDEGGFLFTTDSCGLLKIHSIAGRNCVKELNAHTGEIRCVASEGSFIVTGGQDGLLKLWNVVWEYTF